jgi:flagellar hook protein FlgE
MMDVIGNNIANVNTTGFKAGGRHSAAVCRRCVRQPASILSGGTNPMQVGLGMSINTLDTQFMQGNVRQKTATMTWRSPGGSSSNAGGQSMYTRMASSLWTRREHCDGRRRTASGKMADANGVIPLKRR